MEKRSLIIRKIAIFRAKIFIKDQSELKTNRSIVYIDLMHYQYENDRREWRVKVISFLRLSIRPDL